MFWRKGEGGEKVEREESEVRKERERDDFHFHRLFRVAGSFLLSNFFSLFFSFVKDQNCFFASLPIHVMPRYSIETHLQTVSFLSRFTLLSISFKWKNLFEKMDTNSVTV